LFAHYFLFQSKDSSKNLRELEQLNKEIILPCDDKKLGYMIPSPVPQPFIGVIPN